MQSRRATPKTERLHNIAEVTHTELSSSHSALSHFEMQGDCLPSTHWYLPFPKPIVPTAPCLLRHPRVHSAQDSTPKNRHKAAKYIRAKVDEVAYLYASGRSALNRISSRPMPIPCSQGH